MWGCTWRGEMSLVWKVEGMKMVVPKSRWLMVRNIWKAIYSCRLFSYLISLPSSIWYQCHILEQSTWFDHEWRSQTIKPTCQVRISWLPISHGSVSKCHQTNAKARKYFNLVLPQDIRRKSRYWEEVLLPWVTLMKYGLIASSSFCSYWGSIIIYIYIFLKTYECLILWQNSKNICLFNK